MIIFKLIFGKWSECGLDSSGPEHGAVADFCKHDSEASEFQKPGNFLTIRGTVISTRRTIFME
jgi:hypothetical protein